MPKKLVGSLQMGTPEGEAAYEVAESAHKTMIEMGIYLPERPEFSASRFVHEDGSPRMPLNMQHLGDMDIGELYYIVETFFSYVTGRLAVVSNQYEEAKEVFKFVAAKVRLSKDGKQQDKTDRQIADRRYIVANARALELKCLFNLLSKVRDKLDADMKVISRNITLRDQRIKTGSRVDSIGARRKIATSFRNNRPHPMEGEQEEQEEQLETKVKVRRPPRRRPSIKFKR